MALLEVFTCRVADHRDWPGIATWVMFPGSAMLLNLKPKAWHPGPSQQGQNE